MTVQKLISIMESNGFVVNYRPFELNIVGVRAETTTPNKFDDTIYVFYSDENGNQILKSYPATTDPGTYYLLDPMNELGTAILKPGQYQYQLGYHKGKYKAMVQAAPVTVLRDYDRDSELDFYNGSEYTGWFGINIHKAGENSIDVGQWSAGCQVFARSQDFAEFISLAEKHEQLYGNNFLYTLIDNRSEVRYLRRKIVYGLLFIIAGVLLLYRFKKQIKSLWTKLF